MSLSIGDISRVNSEAAISLESTRSDVANRYVGQADPSG